jgi:hypothetical protein
MLEEFLRKWRRVRSDSSTPAVRAVRCFSTSHLPALFAYRLRAPPVFPRRSSIRCWRSCLREARKRQTSMRFLASQISSSSPRSNPFSAPWVYTARSAIFIQNMVMTRRCLKYGQSAWAPFYMHACIPAASHDLNRRLVEGEWTDPGIPDPLSDMFALLTARRNRALIQQWGVWLAGKDAERALKVGACNALLIFRLRVHAQASFLMTFRSC